MLHQAIDHPLSTGELVRPGEANEQAILLEGLQGSSNRHRSERVIQFLLGTCAAISVLTTVGIVAVLIEQAARFFVKVGITDFLFGTKWTALFKNGEFGVVPLVAGTMFIAVISMLVAIPLGLMAAIYLSEYASFRARSILKPALELLAGIPTLVYGYFALTFITPKILKPISSDTAPYNVLAGAIAVGIMVLPMVASLSEDAIRAVPKSLREAAYGVGATKLEASTRVVVPAALSGIVSAVILAISRAVGETMIVALATGSRAQLIKDPRQPMQAMTGYIVQVFSGDVVQGSTVYYSLFAVGLLLFCITLVMNIISQMVVTRFREEYQ
jgi:phosphate transport system permease protein